MTSIPRVAIADEFLQFCSMVVSICFLWVLFIFVIYFCGLYVLDYLYSSGHIWQALV